jgi:hypothetical protein
MPEVCIGAYNMSALREALDELSGTETVVDYFTLRTARGIERDKMIGAAGELYVSLSIVPQSELR